MAPRKSLTLLFVAIYATLSLFCVVAPSAIPGVSFVSSVLVGPPLLLVWGGSAWLLYALLSLVLAGLGGALLMVRSPEVKVMAGFGIVCTWLGAGLFATALSV
ncbi:hypothetical protein GCM10011521_28270 [Arenimonas soli]|uniref:Uncharacterized protein n=1 Tax=Arenimonas soli TaxID=2269504 RepID=A0ABQ1HUP8_9GAMM|nr:hypothetical protein GCM10011521_28270 [Arenimonas soli]